MSKPVKAKPYFYSCCLKAMQEIAVQHGYNLLIHGSMNRDMDLVAVAWVDEPKTHVDLLDAFSEYLGVPKNRLPDGETICENAKPYMLSILPGGRYSYVINLNRGGRYNNYFDEEYYIDISFTPTIKTH